MDSGKVAVLSVPVIIFFLLSGAAAGLNIESPADGQNFTTDRSITVNITASGGADDISFTIEGTGISGSGSGSVVRSVLVPQGSHTLEATVTDNETEETRSGTVSFLVDTGPPSISSLSPEGVVTDTLDPEISVGYTDISPIDEDSVVLKVNRTVVGHEISGSRIYNDTISLGEGTHTVEVSLDDVHGHSSTERWNFTLPVEPVILSVSPEGMLGGTPERIEVEAVDPSGIDEGGSSIEIRRGGDVVTSVGWEEMRGWSSVDGNALSLAYEPSEMLEDGDYEVVARVEDSRENVREERWDITVDTTPPDLDIVSHSSGDIVNGEESFRAEAEDDLGSVERVVFSIGDVSRETRSGDDGVFDANIDLSGVGDGFHVLSVRALDQSGNAASEEANLTVDNTPPEAVSELMVYPDPAPSKVHLEISVGDESTILREVGYEVSGSDIEGELSPRDGSYDERRETVEGNVDLQGLENGEHKIFVTVEDNAGIRSNRIGKRFVLDRGLSPNLSILREEDIRLVRGETGEYSIDIQNTGSGGEFVELGVETDLNVSVTPGSRRIGSGEKKAFTLEVASDGGDSLGPHEIVLAAEGLSSRDEVESEIILQPPEPVQDRIESSFRSLEKGLQELIESREGYGGSFGGEELESRMDSASSMVSNVSRLIEEGRYARASNVMDDARESLSGARSSFTGAVTQYRIDQSLSLFLSVIAFLLVTGLLVGVYRLVPPEEGYDREKGFVKRPGGKHPLRLRAEDWYRRRFAEEEEEYHVQEWEGFGKED